MDHISTSADRGPDSDGSSSGSTTLSATSSPGGAGNGIGSRIEDGSGIFVSFLLNMTAILFNHFHTNLILMLP